MLPSSTVENYLKALYQAEAANDEKTLVPMGQLATAVKVAPGTATTMVKALAESGLVEYEPYLGVRLSPAGTKLAALVLRRHRLIEQFLVEIMGMNWTEVHEDAEQLEHVVSDKLIDRMDAMLGHPSVDPARRPDTHGRRRHAGPPIPLVGDLSAWGSGESHPGRRPGRQLPAISREAEAEARPVGRGRGTRSGRR